MSATVTIPEGITVIVDDNSRHDLTPGTYPVHATTATGSPVPAGDRPYFLEADIPTSSSPGIVLLRIHANEDHFTAVTDAGAVILPIGHDSRVAA